MTKNNTESEFYVNEDGELQSNKPAWTVTNIWWSKESVRKPFAPKENNINWMAATLGALLLGIWLKYGFLSNTKSDIAKTFEEKEKKEIKKDETSEKDKPNQAAEYMIPDKLSD